MKVVLGDMKLHVAHYICKHLTRILYLANCIFIEDTKHVVYQRT